MLREDQVSLLEGCPGHWRYALTGLQDSAKRCFEDSWNERGHGRTAESVIKINNAPEKTERWKSDRTLGVGVITGEESNGLLVMDFDGKGSQAVRAFTNHFRTPPSKLPRTVMNISGKQGRAKCYFTVPPNWWPQLEGRSASWTMPDGSVALEAIWNNSTGRGRHAVIVGDHPDSSHQNPLWYRWVEGYSPSECPVAEAPEWLLLGILAKIEQGGSGSLQERQRRGEDDATPWERLTAFERRELVESALPYCPNRLARGSGTYEKARRVISGVLNEFGLEFATEILTNSEWDRKNEWEGTDCAKTLASLANSRVSEESKSRIASVFYFAREAGWMPPSWAVPPVEMKAHVEGLKKLLNQFIINVGDSAASAAILGRIRREYGVDSDRVRQLAVDQVLGTINTNTTKTIDEVDRSMRSDNVQTDVIDGLLSRSVHLLVGASHSGKTTLASFLANRVVHGEHIDIDDVRHVTERKGKVLIFSSDCSDHEMVRELGIENITAKNANDRIRICTGASFSDMLFIAKALEDVQPDFVIYDSLMSLTAADVKIGESAIADPIRMLVRHNGKAWPQCAHMILHHTTRDEPTRFSGTEFIKAAAQEMWLYYPPELMTWRKGQPRPVVGPTRHLVFEKSRGGYQGKSLSITRDAYQGTWQWHQNNQDVTPSDLLRSRFRAVQHDRWQIASEWAKELQLPFHSRTLRRYLDQQVGTLLEREKQRSRITGRLDTHYRPRNVIRTAAQMMVGSRGDGVNIT